VLSRKDRGCRPVQRPPEYDENSVGHADAEGSSEARGNGFGMKEEKEGKLEGPATRAHNGRMGIAVHTGGSGEGASP